MDYFIENNFVDQIFLTVSGILIIYTYHMLIQPNLDIANSQYNEF